MAYQKRQENRRIQRTRQVLRQAFVDVVPRKTPGFIGACGR